MTEVFTPITTGAFEFAADLLELLLQAVRSRPAAVSTVMVRTSGFLTCAPLIRIRRDFPVRTRLNRDLLDAALRFNVGFLSPSDYTIYARNTLIS